jgi:hypothetical protein
MQQQRARCAAELSAGCLGVNYPEGTPSGFSPFLGAGGTEATPLYRPHISETPRRVVAEASTEGGFLGFGGVRVTDAEKVSSAEVAQALGAR